MNLKMTGIKQANANLNEIARRLKPDVAAPASLRQLSRGRPTLNWRRLLTRANLLAGLSEPPTGRGQRERLRPTHRTAPQ